MGKAVGILRVASGTESVQTNVRGDNFAQQEKNMLPLLLVSVCQHA